MQVLLSGVRQTPQAEAILSRSAELFCICLNTAAVWVPAAKMNPAGAGSWNRLAILLWVEMKRCGIG
jgi:hypothetical protein